MDCQFLCSKHKAQLGERLEATLPIWSSWMRQGLNAVEQRDFQRSIPFFGCAFELALMQVDRYTAHAEIEGKRYGECLMKSAEALERSLARCGYLTVRRELLTQVRSVLYREQLRTPLLADRLPAPEEAPERFYAALNRGDAQSARVLN